MDCKAALAFYQSTHCHSIFGNSEVRSFGAARVVGGGKRYNKGAAEVDISGWIVHDDNGKDDDEAHTFPSGTMIAAGAYMLLCSTEPNHMESRKHLERSAGCWSSVIS